MKPIGVTAAAGGINRTRWNSRPNKAKIDPAKLTDPAGALAGHYGRPCAAAARRSCRRHVAHPRGEGKSTTTVGLADSLAAGQA